MIHPPFPKSTSASSRPEEIRSVAASSSFRGEEHALIARDSSLGQIFEMASALAPTNIPILIQGEAGTGKSLLSRAIHQSGRGPDLPFVTFSSESWTREPLRDERALSSWPADPAFGDEWANHLRMARGGTLVIEEAAGLPLEIQLLLQRELEIRDREAEAGQPIRIHDVRFIITARESLPSLVERGRFRQELLHRIGGVSLTLAPLRHRPVDIESLADHFLARYAREYRKAITGFTQEAIDTLCRHVWPGNLRELEGVVQRGVAVCSASRVASSHLGPALHGGHVIPATETPRESRPSARRSVEIRPLREALEEPERRIILETLRTFHWNRQETARVLDINRTTLYKKMKKYGLLLDEPSCGLWS